MAGRTVAAAYWIVYYTLLKGFCLFVVTGITELISFLLNETCMLCNMRVMACCAFPFCHRLMNYPVLKRRLFVALEADFLGEYCAAEQENRKNSYGDQKV